MGKDAGATDAEAGWDIVVVGAGAAGLTAAITARRAGCRVLLIEKAGQWGGTSALAGGGVWTPCSPLQAEAGIDDSLADAEAYLADTVPDAGLATAPERQRAFVRGAGTMVAMLCDEGMRWSVDAAHPDYISESAHAIRGRALDPDIVDARITGPWHATMRRSALPVAVSVRDLPLLGRGTSSLRSTLALLKVWLRDKALRLGGRDPVGGGQSLAAQLMAIAVRLGIEIRLGTPMTDLIVEDGHVTGIRSNDAEFRASRGVILASGGTAHAPGRREGPASLASADDCGDGLAVLRRAGAMVDLLDEALWVPVALYPDAAGKLARPGLIQRERAMPHALVVDDGARRFANEGLDYYSFGAAMRAHAPTAWLIIDATHRRRYIFGVMLPGRIPEPVQRSGFFVEADSLDALADRCGLDRARLADTVARFNDGARRGVDPDFAKGSRIYDRFWGDPTKPNPNLGPVETPPFRAVRMQVGDVGTKGGAVTDAASRVLAEATGKPIPGLYAAGTAAAAVTGRSYPGPGLTLGPAMTFAYIAATHAARANQGPE